MILWFLPVQDSTHDFYNANQLTNKTNHYCKNRLDAAYRQIHANATTALMCISIVYEIDFLCLRLPFGTTPASTEYTTVSEASIDLVNYLLQDESWDTDDLN